MAEAVRSPDKALAEWEDLLREQSIRITPIRVLLLERLENAGYASAEALYAATLPLSPGLNLTTIYRTLDLLIDHGLVTETPGRTVRLFLVARGGGGHFVCGNCRMSLPLESATLAVLKREALLGHGFDLGTGPVSITGRCSTCKPQEATAGDIA